MDGARDIKSAGRDRDRDRVIDENQERKREWRWGKDRESEEETKIERGFRGGDKERERVKLFKLFKLIVIVIKKISINFDIHFGIAQTFCN
jgi:hypothetical protein